MPVQEFTFDDIKNILVNRIGLSEAASDTGRRKGLRPAQHVHDN